MVKGFSGIDRYGRARLGVEVDTLEAYIHTHVSTASRNGRWVGGIVGYLWVL